MAGSRNKPENRDWRVQDVVAVGRLGNWHCSLHTLQSMSLSMAPRPTPMYIMRAVVKPACPMLCCGCRTGTSSNHQPSPQQQQTISSKSNSHKGHLRQHSALPTWDSQPLKFSTHACKFQAQLDYSVYWRNPRPYQKTSWVQPAQLMQRSYAENTPSNPQQNERAHPFPTCSFYRGALLSSLAHVEVDWRHSCRAVHQQPTLMGPHVHQQPTLMGPIKSSQCPAPTCSSCRGALPSCRAACSG
jgi:hypothetical protein